MIHDFNNLSRPPITAVSGKPFLISKSRILRSRLLSIDNFVLHPDGVQKPQRFYYKTGSRPLNCLVCKTENRFIKHLLFGLAISNYRHCDNTGTDMCPQNGTHF